jgi:hypothetical protein
MTATTTTATLIATNPHGLELRRAKDGDAWPGYGIPLRSDGYWVGNERSHRYVGHSAAEARQVWATTYDGRAEDVPLTLWEARKSGWNVVRGAYSGTTDNRLDRWYPVRIGILMDRTGAGYRTQREALARAHELLLAEHADDVDQYIRAQSAYLAETYR